MVTYRFGPFELDAATRRLTRDGEAHATTERQLDVLLHLLAHAGEVVSKDALIDAAWAGMAVTDNSLEQVISALRRILGPPPDGPGYVETLARRGYRFAAPVTRDASRHSDAALETILAPHRAFVEGRASLETLDADHVVRARAVFEQVIRSSPDYAPAHVGLATALVLRFEAMRAVRAPDPVELSAALHHASEACRLDPSYAEAWATLGLACRQSRDEVRASAALKRATTLEPDNWRHHVRSAYVSWGEERLRSARRALQLFPGSALAYWLEASVYVARQALAHAERELVAGALAQDRQREGGKFLAAGLHLMLGLVRLACGDEDASLREFERELDAAATQSIYGLEAHANAFCAIGAIHLRHRDRASASVAFERALAVIPGHATALAALHVLSPGVQVQTELDARLSALRACGSTIEAATAEAAHAALMGDARRACGVMHAAIAGAPPGSAGWTVPVDPLLDASSNRDVWEPVLALLRNRAA